MICIKSNFPVLPPIPVKGVVLRTICDSGKVPDGSATADRGQRFYSCTEIFFIK